MVELSTGSLLENRLNCSSRATLSIISSICSQDIDVVKESTQFGPSMLRVMNMYHSFSQFNSDSTIPDKFIILV